MHQIARCPLCFLNTEVSEHVETNHDIERIARKGTFGEHIPSFDAPLHGGLCSAASIVRIFQSPNADAILVLQHRKQESVRAADIKDRRIPCVSEEVMNTTRRAPDPARNVFLILVISAGRKIVRIKIPRF